MKSRVIAFIAPTDGASGGRSASADGACPPTDGSSGGRCHPFHADPWFDGEFTFAGLKTRFFWKRLPV